MTRDEITALFNRRYDNWNRRDTAALVRDFAEDGVVESPLSGKPARGRAAIEDLHKMFFAAFPDATMRWDDLVIDGNHVVGVARVSGTDQGGFMGLPPSGRSFEFTLASLYEIENGLIVHERRIYDFTGLLVQVGALKAKPI
jgi:steroid delta-isomerase-like uncharacterized protein